LDASGNIKRFLEYVAENPNARPAFHLKVRAMPASTPPTFAYTMPLGDAIAFSGFLVFLTTVTDKPGAKIAWNFMVEYMADNIRTRMTIARWATHPASILADVAKALASKGPKEHKLEQALASPNSFYVPFDRLQRVEAGRQLTQGPYVKVSTLDGDYILHQDAAVEPWLKGMKTALGGQWEPEFTAFLQTAAARNR
jgi:hypothetical protein